MTYKIHNESSFLKNESLRYIEERYNAKYVFESPLKNQSNSWTNMPVAVFYTEEAHPKGSNYFGVYGNKEGQIMICDALSATKEPFTAVLIDGTDVIYSRYGHDYRELKGVFVDGGRDYIRCGAKDMNRIKLVSLQVEADKLIVKKLQD